MIYQRGGAIIININVIVGPFLLLTFEVNPQLQPSFPFELKEFPEVNTWQAELQLSAASDVAGFVHTLTPWRLSFSVCFCVCVCACGRAAADATWRTLCPAARMYLCINIYRSCRAGKSRRTAHRSSHHNDVGQNEPDKRLKDQNNKD